MVELPLIGVGCLPARRHGGELAELIDVFRALTEAVKSYSLAQISHALYDVDWEYQRNI